MLVWFRTRQLRSERVDVRKRAARALGGFRSPKAVAALVKASRCDLSADVRQEVASALGAIASPEAVLALRALLLDRFESVRHAAGVALKSIGWDAPDNIAKACIAVVFSDWDQAARLGDAAIEPLKLSGLSGHDQAIAVLGRMQSKDSFVALLALGVDSQARPELTQAFRAAYQRRHDLPLLRMALAEVDPTDRARYAAKLATIVPPPLQVEVLGELAASADPAIRTQATQSLYTMLSSPDEAIRHAAGKALKAAAWDPPDAIAHASIAVAMGDFDVAARLGDAAIKPLKRAVLSGSSEAVSVFGRMRSDASLVALLAIGVEANGARPKLKQVFLDAYRRRHDLLQLRSVLATLNEGDRKLCFAVLNTIMPVPIRLEILVGLSSDNGCKLQQDALSAIARVGTSQHSDESVRDAIVKHLLDAISRRPTETSVTLLSLRNKFATAAVVRWLCLPGPELGPSRDRLGQDKLDVVRALIQARWKAESPTEQAWEAAASRRWDELARLGAVASDAIVAALVRLVGAGFSSRHSGGEILKPILYQLGNAALPFVERMRQECSAHANDAQLSVVAGALGLALADPEFLWLEAIGQGGFYYFKELAKTGEAAAPWLIRGLSHADQEVRKHCLAYLPLTKAPMATEHLVRRLSESEWSSICAIIELDRPEGVERLMKWISNQRPDWYFRDLALGRVADYAHNHYGRLAYCVALAALDNAAVWTAVISSLAGTRYVGREEADVTARLWHLLTTTRTGNTKVCFAAALALLTRAKPEYLDKCVRAIVDWVVQSKGYEANDVLLRVVSVLRGPYGHHVSHQTLDVIAAMPNELRYDYYWQYTDSPTGRESDERIETGHEIRSTSCVDLKLHAAALRGR